MTEYDMKRCRVNIDISNARCIADPSKNLRELVEYTLGQGITTAVIDIDKSREGVSSFPIMTLLSRYPGRLWYGGGIRTTDEIAQILYQGAAGVVMGSALFQETRFHTGLFEAIIHQFPADKILFSIDYQDDFIFTNAFTQKIRLRKSEIMLKLAEYPAGLQFAFVNIGASQNRVKEIALNPIAEIHGALDQMRLWYAGNIRTWSQVNQINALGVGAIVGQNYLNGILGLEDETNE